MTNSETGSVAASATAILSPRLQTVLATWQNETDWWPPGRINAVNFGNSVSIKSISRSRDAMSSCRKSGFLTLSFPGAVARSAPIVNSLSWISFKKTARFSLTSWSRSKPRKEFNSSMVPYASILKSDFGTRRPPSNDVIPWSPVLV